MTRLLLISTLALGILFSGCSNLRQAKTTPAPEWVTNRPVSSQFYIGIGSASPNAIPGESMRIAKERAAADLAGEISVTVQSSSLLESEERNGQVREDFSSTITSKAEERIAGFQIVDSWEGAQGSYIYYRLDKARYAAQRNARRQEAISLAVAECEAGQQDLDEGNIQGALDHWGAGVLGLEEFWNEVNQATVDGIEVNMEAHLIRAMREAIRNLDLRAAVDRITLSASNEFRFPLGLHATHGGMNVKGVPLQYRYHNGTYMKRATEFTDDEGTVVAIISDVAHVRPDRKLTCTVDVPRVLQAAGLNAILKELIGTINVDRISVPIKVVMPSVRVIPSPSSRVETSLHNGTITELQSLLIDEGFIISESSTQSDFVILLELRSEQREPSSNLANFHTAYVEGKIAVRNARDAIVNQIILDRVKGVQLNASTALNLALSNMAQTIREKHGNTIVQSLN